VALVLDYHEDQGSRRVGVKVEGDNREVIGPTKQGQVESVQLLPIVARTHQNSIQIGRKIIISRDPELSSHLGAVRKEETDKVDLVAIGPSITAGHIDPFGSRDAGEVRVFEVVVQLVAHSLADGKGDGSG